MSNMTIDRVRRFAKLLRSIVRKWPLRSTRHRLRVGQRRVQEWIYEFRHPDSLIAPPSLTPPGDFQKIGREFKGHFIALGGLRPNHRVLDVGCGSGRMALPLLDYISAEGEYHGFDIMRRSVRWCQHKITPRFPNFHFYHSNVHNVYYNAKGKYAAESYVFPWDDAFFDFVFLTSVFTHMRRNAVAHYLAEIRRILKPQGRCFMTWLLLNDEAKAGIEAGRSTFRFMHAFEGCRVENPDSPEQTIAYEESRMFDMLSSQGFVVLGPVHYGRWSGQRVNALSFQDIVVVEKRRAGL